MSLLSEPVTVHVAITANLNCFKIANLLVLIKKSWWLNTLVTYFAHKSSIWANPQELDDPVPSWCTHLATSWTTIQCWLLAGSSAGIHWRTSVPFLLGLPVGLLVLPHSMVARL